jgi:hypothetical protein
VATPRDTGPVVTPPPAAATDTGMGWKTILGAIVWAVGYLLQPGVLAALPEKVAAIVQAVGAVLAVFGFRSAQAKTQAAAAYAAVELQSIRRRLGGGF